MYECDITVTSSVNLSIQSILLIEPSELKCKGVQYCGSCPLIWSGACCHLKQEKTTERLSIEKKRANWIPVSCPHIYCKALGICYLNNIILLRSNNRCSFHIMVLTTLTWTWKRTNWIVGKSIDLRLVNSLACNISTWLEKLLFTIFFFPS